MTDNTDKIKNQILELAIESGLEFADQAKDSILTFAKKVIDLANEHVSEVLDDLKSSKNNEEGNNEGGE